MRLFFNKLLKLIILKLKRIYHEIFIFKFFDNEKIFSNIYKNNYWGSKTSKSGPGSDFINTIKIRKELPIIIKKYKINSIYDAPCGDFFWMKKVVDKVKIKYIGSDIVPELIAINNTKFSSKYHKFLNKDLSKSKFPKSDLWICRALLFHLDYKTIKKIFKNLRKSKIKYILITNSFTKKKFKNIDILNGNYRQLDLFKHPFNFKENYIYKFNDTFHPITKKVDQQMILWRKKDLIENLKYFI